jgi:excisionase family DNA binding protein
MAQNAAQTIPPESNGLVMSGSEAAQLLGISKRTLERYVRESRVPYVEVPRRGGMRTLVKFLRPQLLKWLEQRTVRPAHVAARNLAERSA